MGRLVAGLSLWTRPTGAVTMGSSLETVGAVVWSGSRMQRQRLLIGCKGVHTGLLVEDRGRGNMPTMRREQICARQCSSGLWIIVFSSRMSSARRHPRML